MDTFYLFPTYFLPDCPKILLLLNGWIDFKQIVLRTQKAIWILKKKQDDGRLLSR